MSRFAQTAILARKCVRAVAFLLAAGGLTSVTHDAGVFAQTKTGISPIINEYGLLLGGSRASQWVSWQSAHARVRGGEKYRLYSLNGLVSEVRGGPPVLSEASRNAYTVKIPERGENDRTPLVGLSCAWNPLPRKAAAISPVQKVYLDAVAEVLKQHGLTRAAPHINKILRVDLTGKGSDSVVVEAASPGYSVSMDADAKARGRDAYSFVMLRTIVQGKVRTYVLDGEFGHKGSEAPSQNFALANVIDLNGDGTLEIVVETSYYEGGGDEVFEIRNGRPKRVLQVEDGV